MVDQQQTQAEGTDVQKLDVAPVNKKGSARAVFARPSGKIHPKRTDGFFRKLKWWVMIVSLGIYYLAPWLRWDRGPHAPDQAILVDLNHERFFFFFIELWPQEVYYLTGLLIMAAAGLFFITALIGRAWCGFACPQTVWTDLFVQVERFIEGDRNERIKLDRAPWSVSKLRKRITKFILWFLISLATGGAWIFYFADAPTLAWEMLTLQAPFIAYSSMLILAFTTFLLGGFAREKICTYMCPWPRIQGAMLDNESLVIAYRAGRGEPRGVKKKKKRAKAAPAAAEAKAAPAANDAGIDIVKMAAGAETVPVAEPEPQIGHCVDCNACIAACPMGIDIRDGFQLECIGCGLCIDACDTIMDKVKYPRGLIAYESAHHEQERAAGNDNPKTRWIRAVPVVYFAIWLIAGAVMLYGLATRPDFDVKSQHDRSPKYVRLSDGSIRNGYTIKVMNKQRKDVTYILGVDGLNGPVLSSVGAEGRVEALPDGRLALKIGPDRVESFKVYIAAYEDPTRRGRVDVDLVLLDSDTGNEARHETFFNSPGR